MGEAVVAAVRPCRGRLLFFPHMCPHLARPTLHVPKLLLRGEMYGCRSEGHIQVAESLSNIPTLPAQPQRHRLWPCAAELRLAPLCFDFLTRMFKPKRPARDDGRS